MEMQISTLAEQASPLNRGCVFPKCSMDQRLWQLWWWNDGRGAHHTILGVT